MVGLHGSPNEAAEELLCQHNTVNFCTHSRGNESQSQLFVPGNGRRYPFLGCPVENELNATYYPLKDGFNCFHAQNAESLVARVVSRALTVSEN